MLLGGHSLEDPDAYCRMLRVFWQRFRHVRPEHDVYDRADAEAGFDLGFCIPVAIHGDEGRGKLKRPVMVLSYQPLISFKGPRFVNSSGCLGS